MPFIPVSAGTGKPSKLTHVDFSACYVCSVFSMNDLSLGNNVVSGGGYGDLLQGPLKLQKHHMAVGRNTSYPGH